MKWVLQFSIKMDIFKDTHKWNLRYCICSMDWVNEASSTFFRWFLVFLLQFYLAFFLTNDFRFGVACKNARIEKEMRYIESEIFVDLLSIWYYWCRFLKNSIHEFLKMHWFLSKHFFDVWTSIPSIIFIDIM